MGCDIHIYIEYKVGDGPWQADKHHVEDEDKNGRIVTAISPRDYTVFAVLAGVRGIGPKPRGIPSDVSSVVCGAHKYWRSDAHSPSWITLSSFKKKIKKLYPHLNFNVDGVGFRDHSKSWVPLGFNHLIKYCEEQVKNIRSELIAEAYLLASPEEMPKVKCRLVFFFDN